MVISKAVKIPAISTMLLGLVILDISLVVHSPKLGYEQYVGPLVSVRIIATFLPPLIGHVLPCCRYSTTLWSQRPFLFRISSAKVSIGTIPTTTNATSSIVMKGDDGRIFSGRVADGSPLFDSSTII